MSLNQFLALGRSFTGVRDEPSPYRVVHERLLPKFGMEGEETEVSPAKGKGWVQWFRWLGFGSAEGAGRPPGAASERGRRRSSWAGMARGASRGRALVQGELALEQVKVVRNDLCDADLEVVPVSKEKAREAVRAEELVEETHWAQSEGMEPVTEEAAPEAPAVATPVLEPAGAEAGWSRLSVRLFQMNQAKFQSCRT